MTGQKLFAGDDSAGDNHLLDLNVLHKIQHGIAMRIVYNEF